MNKTQKTNNQALKAFNKLQLPLYKERKANRDTRLEAIARLYGREKITPSENIEFDNWATDMDLEIRSIRYL